MRLGLPFFMEDIQATSWSNSISDMDCIWIRRLYNTMWGKLNYNRMLSRNDSIINMMNNLYLNKT